MGLKHCGKSAKNMITQLSSLKTKLPSMVGSEAVNFFQENFRKQGFQGDNGLEKWPERSDQSKKNKGRAILVKSGIMRRAITKRFMGGSVTVYVGSPANEYADIHNFGFRGVQYVKPHKRVATIKTKVKGGYMGLGQKQKSKTLSLMGARHNVSGFGRRMNMPKRQFIGNSKVLNQRINKLIVRELTKILKP
jgi:phage gpG-like protein